MTLTTMFMIYGAVACTLIILLVSLAQWLYNSRAQPLDQSELGAILLACVLWPAAIPFILIIELWLSMRGDHGR